MRQATTKTIQKLIGNITPEQMKHVDAFVSHDLGIFIPVTGPCYYAITPNHHHPGYLFIYAFDNYCLTAIGNQPIRSHAGHLYALSPNLIHHEIIENKQARYIAIMITPKYFETIYKLYGAKPKNFCGDEYLPKKDLLPILKEFMFESENKYPGYENILKALSLKITHSIVRSVLRENETTEKSDLRMEINKVLEYIHAHFAEKITLENMANIAIMSESHFSRVFKKETGKSPLEYLIHLRLQRVKKLLLAGDKNISEIALNCGFSSSAHLAECFKQKFKLSPSEFKKRLN